MKNPVAWYDVNADIATARFGRAEAPAIHGWFEDLLPEAPATALDVGAGTGRDAAWLASKGFDVIAAEPSTALRKIGRANHPDAEVQWVSDRLPTLATVTSSGLSFDIILVSAVWMHIAAGDRPRAFRKMINLLKPGGLLVISLRMGREEAERGIHRVSAAEVESLARDHGGYVEKHSESKDVCGREDVRWESLAVRLPDDGSGALPLLRHVILNDNKSSTYKLALLRTLCRIADGAPGLADDSDEEFTAVPFGLVALTWIRLFMPLLAADLPQSPSNTGLRNLGFVKDAYRRLASVPHRDLRVGVSFSGHAAADLHQALKDAAANIEKMPATYITYPNGQKVFPVKRLRSLQRPARIRLDGEYLRSFGMMLVPSNLWTTLRRFDAWIEPAIVAEWSKLIGHYCQRQQRHIDSSVIAAAMTWEEPTRDVQFARGRALSILEGGKLFCTWSGKRLSPKNLDIDHCIPWTAWPCGDLWNLMPAHRAVNQYEKRAKLPADRLLRHSQDRVIGWWEHAYVDSPPAVSERFWLEARSSLPRVASDDSTLEDIFDAMRYQRIRLKHDQQVPEWQGEKHLLIK